MAGDMTQGLFERVGGAVYNRGDSVVDGESYFSFNTASVRLYVLS